jgi:hypothetical protein
MRHKRLGFSAEPPYMDKSPRPRCQRGKLSQRWPRDYRLTGLHPEVAVC